MIQPYELSELQMSTFTKAGVLYKATFLKISPKNVYWELFGPQGRVNYGTTKTKSSAIREIKSSMIYL